MSKSSPPETPPVEADAPAKATALVAEGEALAARGNLVNAQALYQEACRIDPENAEKK